MIYNPIVWGERAPALQKSDIEKRPPLVLAVGRLVALKQFDMLLRAFARLNRPYSRLVILGEGPERARLDGCQGDISGWRRWGPYMSERSWASVREDYSPDGSAWDYFPHDLARSKAYRWGEDGIAGISDVDQRLCFALALWNGRDMILKERLFGLTNGEGNHGDR